MFLLRHTWNVIKKALIKVDTYLRMFCKLDGSKHGSGMHIGVYAFTNTDVDFGVCLCFFLMLR